MKTLFATWLVLIISFLPVIGFCSDHVDGPVTTSMPIKDISDLYVFKTPDKKDSLSVVLNVRPFALSWHHFDAKVYYRIVFRKAHIDYVARSIPTDSASEVTLICRFKTSSSGSLIQAHCQSNNGLKAAADFNSMNFIKYIENSFKLYAGFRADPFFIDKDFTSAFINDLKIAKQTKENVMTKLNVLSLVMDIPIAKLFPNQPQARQNLIQKKANTKVAKASQKNLSRIEKREPAQIENYLIAVAAESHSTEPDAVWDIVGRPEITNVTMHARKGMADLRDKFNKPKAFYNYDKDKAFFNRIYNNIQSYDMIDGRQDFSPGQLGGLASVLVNDYLVIDPFSPDCARSSYFAIEMAALTGKKPDSCGGRDLNDHFLDVLFTTFVKGLNPNQSSIISDGLSGPEKPISKVFPYLNEPTTGAQAYLKATAAQIFPP